MHMYICIYIYIIHIEYINNIYIYIRKPNAQNREIDTARSVGFFSAIKGPGGGEGGARCLGAVLPGGGPGVAWICGSVGSVRT